MSLKKELPLCAKEGCENRVKEHRRRYCSPRCSGNNGNSAATSEKMAKRRVVAKRTFLIALKKYGTLSVAAQHAGIHMWTVRDWRRRDEEFDKAIVEATEHVCDVVESSLVTRALEGEVEPLFYKGERVGEKRTYGTAVRAAEIYLRGRRPSVFGDHVAIAHSGPDGQPLVPSLNAIQIVVRDASDIDVAQLKQLPAPTTVREKLARRADELGIPRRGNG